MLMPNFIVKVCGLTSVEDAQAALDAGANALGFNFYAKSPRYLPAAQAAKIILQLHGDFLRVGVFVNPLDSEISQVADLLDVAQIHGTGKALIPTWRAIGAGERPAPDLAVDAWLMDTFSPQYGGSGKTFDWSLAAHFPYRAIIAGGLDSANVTEAIQIARPFGVDSCSRLESSPGRKDHELVAGFVRNATEAFHALQEVNI